MSGPLIHGEHAADVGGGGHGRHRAADRANLPGQVIRPAQMAAEMGLSERAVEGKLYRLRKQLRRALGGDEA